MSKLIDQLCDLLKECGVTPKIGLEAQGHIPTVERMLAEGKTWDEIAKAVRWSDGATVKEWYLLYLTRNLDQPE